MRGAPQSHIAHFWKFRYHPAGSDNAAGETPDA